MIIAWRFYRPKITESDQDVLENKMEITVD
jgi:hypothetical protein